MPQFVDRIFVNLVVTSSDSVQQVYKDDKTLNKRINSLLNHIHEPGLLDDYPDLWGKMIKILPSKSEESALMILNKTSNLNEKQVVLSSFLIECAKSNDVKLAQFIIKKGKELGINSLDECGIEMFREASSQHSEGILKLLCEEGLKEENLNGDDLRMILNQPKLWELLLKNNPESRSLLEMRAKLIMDEDPGEEIIRKNWDHFKGLHNREEAKYVIQHFNIDEIRELLPENETELNKLLFLACDLENLDLIEEIIKKGGKVNSKNKNGQTPLFAACLVESSPKVIKCLIDQGANINARDTEGHTPLHVACWNENLEIAEYLIEQGANINLAKFDGDSPLHLVAKSDGDSANRLFEMLLQNANPNLKNQSGETALHHCIVSNDLDKIDLLLSHGANPNLLNESDQKQLNQIIKNNPGRLKLPISITYGDFKAFVNKAGSHTIAMEMMQKNDSDFVAFEDLKRFQKLPGIQEFLNQSLQERILKHNDLKVAEHLIALGADINGLNRDGDSLLQSCLKANSDSSIITFLLKHGADPNLRDKDGLPAFHNTASLEKLEILLQYGADPDIVYPASGTFLCSLLSLKNKEDITLFYQYGGDIDIAMEIIRRKVAANCLGLAGENYINGNKFELEGLHRSLAFSYVAATFEEFLNEDDPDVKSIPEEIRKKLNDTVQNVIIIQEQDDKQIEVEEAATKIKNKEPVIIAASWSGHTITVTVNKGRIIISNRGEGAFLKNGRAYAQIYEYPESLTTEQLGLLVKRLAVSYENLEEYEKMIKEEQQAGRLVLAEREIENNQTGKEISQKPQAVANCTIANSTAAILELCIAELGTEKGFRVYKKYKAYLRDYAITAYKNDHPDKENDLLYDANFLRELEKKERKYLSRHEGKRKISSTG